VDADAGIPPAVTTGLDEPVSELWRARLRQHTEDAYAGIGLSKFPEDLRVYEHLLWLTAPDAVIEIGAQFGASTLWFRDRLRTLAEYDRLREPRVIAIDIDADLLRETLEEAHGDHLEGIEVLGGDVRDPELPGRVERLLPPGARCMVVEDSAHVYDTTTAALRGFARFVPVGGYFVVEDGCVDVEEARIDEHWPRGVLPAVRDWLASPQGSAFEVRRDHEAYGITCHPSGFLRRHAPNGRG
jgi:cephalosporin hydroxylase